MKVFKRVGLILFFVLSAVSISAQEFQFGILFDPAITWLRSDVADVTRDRARTGFDLGLVIDRYFSENYAISTGVSLLNIGGTLKYDNEFSLHTKDENVVIAPGGKVKYKIQYFKIPAALKFKTHMMGRMVYSANVGLDLMVRMAARADYNDVSNAKVNKEIKLFNVGWHFGGGVQYSLGGDTSVFGGLSYMNTFMDMTKPSHEKITSNNLMLRIGVLF
jgi:hypothetical protein